MKSFAAIIATALLAASSVQAQEWVGVDAGGSSGLGYDRASVQETDSGREVLAITVWAHSQRIGGQPFDFMTSRHLVDCENERARALEGQVFSLDAERPIQLLSDPGEWKPHNRGTHFGQLILAVCGTMTLSNRTPFATAHEFATYVRGLLNP